MKKSKAIQLVLITAALASCNNNAKKENWAAAAKGKQYVRGDSTAPYTRTHLGLNSGLLWLYAFRPYYGYNNGVYGRTGFYSGAINARSNYGSNTSKARTIRGGFGRSSRVSS